MNVNSLREQLEDYLEEDKIDFALRAFDFAGRAHEGQYRASGEPYIEHPLAVASILAQMKLDFLTIAAALLHDVLEDTGVKFEDIESEFGQTVAELVDGVTKLLKVEKEDPSQQDSLQTENLRRLFLAMVDDIRIILVKFADRLHNMQTLSSLPIEQQHRIAKETLEIYAPLAERLGMWKLKLELEDLSFKTLEPDKYQLISNSLEKRRRQDRYISKAVTILEKELARANIEANVSGRVKHIYSIYKKILKANLEIDQVHDLFGLRVIVNEIADCYTALGIVHKLWKQVEKKPSGEPGFVDHISRPKDNQYRSIHTLVLGPEAHLLEIQIRTKEMHQEAEYGIAAHWRYKEGAKRDIYLEERTAWLRQVIERYRESSENAWDFVDSIKTDIFPDWVYVWTPKGDIIELPLGSTPIDFAYHIHTEIGHRCRGAKVNGRLVSLDYQLETGDQVEILAAKRGGPSRDWLNPHLGYIKTSRARQKISQWFRRQDRTETVAQGRQLLEKELKRLGLDRKNYEKIAALLKFDKVEDFLAAIGYGDVNVQQIATRLIEAESQEEEPELPEAAPPPPEVSGVTVRGVGDLLTRVAGCCHPLPGDPVVGYVTRGRGITIHRRDCRNVLYLEDKERLIEVDWGEDFKQVFPVMVQVSAYDRTGLMRDITEIMAGERINITSANVATHPKDHTAVITATLEISSIVQLSRVLAKIERLPNVFEARRKAN